MTINLAIEYIPRRMAELGYGPDKYYMRFRHILILPRSSVEVPAFNQLFILVEETQDVRVSSDLGLFDLSTDNTNEMQYEHQGQITLTNQAFVIRHVRFIQIIFKTC